MTDRYAVFGNPIEHSLSPRIHNSFAEALGDRVEYNRLCVPLDGFDEAVQSFFSSGGRGLNITLPFKQHAFIFADELSARALQAGAVNTLIPTAAGQVRGDNTDGIGLMRDLSRNLNWAVEDKRVLMIGAGGAVRGVLEPLLLAGPALLVLVNRTPSRAQELEEDFANVGSIIVRDFAALAVAKQSFDLVINGTSAGQADELPPLPENLLRPNGHCYDLQYGAAAQPFLHWGEAQGGTVSDGLGMLVEQAAESFNMWRGVEPDTAPVLKVLRQEQAAQ